MNSTQTGRMVNRNNEVEITVEDVSLAVTEFYAKIKGDNASRLFSSAIYNFIPDEAPTPTEYGVYQRATHVGTPKGVWRLDGFGWVKPNGEGASISEVPSDLVKLVPENSKAEKQSAEEKRLTYLPTTQRILAFFC